MPNYNDIYFGTNSSKILLEPIGRKFTESDEEIARKDVMSSGKKVKDIIAFKKRFKCQYDLIEHTHLESILTYVNSGDALELDIRRHGYGLTDTYDVFALPLTKERSTTWSAGGSAWWSNVLLEFEEI